MRLLFISHSFPPADYPLGSLGGMQRVAMDLYDALGAHTEVRLDPIILRSTFRMSYVVGLPYLARVYRETRRKALRGDSDAVLFTSMATAAMLAPLLRPTLAPLGIPMAAIVHGRDVTLRGPYQWILRRAFAALDAVLPVSQATGAECVDRGLDPARLFVVPNGVDVERFEPLHDFTARRLLLDALGDPAHPLPADALVLCSVGRQVERKGFAWFVDVVMPLLPDDVHYWLAGNGPEAENIAAAAERRGLQDRVRLLGRVSEDDLSALYRGADLFVMPNIPVTGDMEGFGVVMLEAGLSGMPVIGSRLEGIQDVITEGRNGHLVESQDAWAFSETIMAYYHNRHVLESASQEAARHTRQTFCWSAVANRYVQTLSDLLPTAPSTTLDRVTQAA